MMRCWRREEVQESQGPRVPRSRGPKDQDISNSHSEGMSPNYSYSILLSREATLGLALFIVHRLSVHLSYKFIKRQNEASK